MENAKIFASNSHLGLAEEIAENLKIPLGQRTLKEFSCGELYINYDETVRGKDVFIIGTIRPITVHQDFFELFLMCDAARRSFAKSIHVIVPHFGYSRQDKIHKARESISMKVCADMLVQSGAQHVMTLHLHADQSQAFFNVPVDNLSAKKIFVEYFQQKDIKDPVVVSPDAGGAKNTKHFADALGLEMAILHKSRPEHNDSVVTHLVGDVKGKTCIIYDDLIDTAGSVFNAKKALVENGANPDVYLCATHPVFSGPAIERLNKAAFKEIVVSNSIPVATDKINNIKPLSIAPLMAMVIQYVVEERSISTLYL
jgi:ribose-phosphate pyrophosphokinase